MSNPLSSVPGSAEPPRVLTSAPPGLPVAVRLSLVKYLFSTRMREVVLVFLIAAFMQPAGIGLLLFADTASTTGGPSAWPPSRSSSS